MTFKQFFKYWSYTALIWTGISTVISMIAMFGIKAIIDIDRSMKKAEEVEED